MDSSLASKLRSLALKGVVNLIDAIPLVAKTLLDTTSDVLYLSKGGKIVLDDEDFEYDMGVKIDLPSSTIATYGTPIFHHISPDGLVEIFSLSGEFEFRRKDLKKNKSAPQIAVKVKELIALAANVSASDVDVISNVSSIMSMYDVPHKRVTYHRKKGFLLPIIQETPLVFDCINKLFDRLGDPNVGFENGNSPTIVCYSQKNAVTIAHSKTGSTMKLSNMNIGFKADIVGELTEYGVAPTELLYSLPSDQLYYVWLQHADDLKLYPEDFRESVMQLIETSSDYDGKGEEYYLLSCMEIWRVTLQKILECKICIESIESRDLLRYITASLVNIGKRKPTIDAMLNLLVPDSMLPKALRNSLSKKMAIFEVKERGLAPEGLDLRGVPKICLIYLVHQDNIKAQAIEDSTESTTNSEVMTDALGDLLKTLSDEVKLKLLRCITNNNTDDVEGTIQTFLSASRMSVEELSVFAGVDLVTKSEPTKEEKIWRNVKECLDALEEDESEIFISLAFKACTFLKNKPMIVWNYMDGLRIYSDCFDAQAIAGYLSGNNRLGNFLSSPSEGYVVTYDTRPITVKKSPTCSDSLLILV